MAQLTEHLSKEVLKRYGVPVNDGHLVASREEAFEAAATVRAPVVVKVQGPFGGRGKCGGIERADNPRDAMEAFDRVISVRIDGLTAQFARVEPYLRTDLEIYAGVALDPETMLPVVLISTDGGVEVEGA